MRPCPAGKAARSGGTHEHTPLSWSVGSEGNRSLPVDTNAEMCDITSVCRPRLRFIDMICTLFDINNSSYGTT